MNCSNCGKAVGNDQYFCSWCETFAGGPGGASGPGGAARPMKANVFRRWVAWTLDPLLAVFAWLLGTSIIGAISTDLGIVAAVVLPFIYFIWFLRLLAEGRTPGKRLMGLRVVRVRDGGMPGFGLMLLREIPGRALSGLVLGIGYLWALFDKNGQAWHDRLASTVVVAERPAA